MEVRYVPDDRVHDQPRAGEGRFPQPEGLAGFRLGLATSLERGGDRNLRDSGPLRVSGSRGGGRVRRRGVGCDDTGPRGCLFWVLASVVLSVGLTVLVNLALLLL
ncbi:hypothetical protein GBA65_15435 [Rubrobacter marinus]|uniref:Uncharacterized protein n=1 Tax=Rubrobacter marinus TaxID=2653852 RepID=A0A6G8PZR5_9ACTN|nr:hypothetical protein GBA65_15435 [Rubrobacter marinus]